MAGIAAGLAASVKFTFLVPVAAIAVGVVLFSGRGRRWTTAWVMGRADVRGRRLLVPAGGDQDRRQPDPDHQVRAAQPAQARTRCRSTRGPASPSPHYLGEPTIYRKWFFPELDNALGPLWPLILIVAGAAAVYIAWRSRNRILRVLAAAALATASSTSSRR